ncbi:hypothetical protein ACFQ9X_48390 [Catenulispora yoronensis]
MSLVLSDLDAGEEPPLPGLIAPAMERGARLRRRRRASGAAAMTAGVAGVVLVAFGALTTFGGTGASPVIQTLPAGFERLPAPSVVAAVAAVAPGRTAIAEPARDPAAVRVELVWSAGLAEVQVHAARDGSGCPGTLAWAGGVSGCAPGADGRSWTFVVGGPDDSSSGAGTGIGIKGWGAAHTWPDGTRVIVVAGYRDALNVQATTPPISLTALSAIAADPRSRDAAH